MKLSRRIMSSSGLQTMVCWLCSLYIRLVHKTVRWQVVNGDIPQRFWDDGKPFIGCLWHGRFLLMPFVFHNDRPSHVLISNHSDGRLIAKVARYLGINAITGSTNRGGTAALKTMVKYLKAGESVAITPDGPRGPRMRASQGVVALARLSGIPVVPATCSTSRRKVIGSWDRFLLCLPFGRGVYMWGEPLEIPRDADAQMQEDFRLRIEDALNELCTQADTMMGQPVISPDAPEVSDVPDVPKINQGGS